MKCENCNKFIWFWNDWRNKGAIIIDRTHPKYMLTIHFCSEKCYLEYSKRYDWLIKKPKNYKTFEDKLTKNKKELKEIEK
jgi:hypothetical protein